MEIARSAFLYAGQICISTQRILIHQSQYDYFLEELRNATESLTSGSQWDMNTVNGPLIDRDSLERVHEWVGEALAEDAELISGGYILDDEHNIYAPTILTNTHSGMKVVSEEIFGPVVIVEEFDSFSDALDIVNDSRYGLQAAVYTNDLNKFKEASQKLQVGAILFNRIPGTRLDAMPYGGIKDSGQGKEGPLFAMQEFTREKLIWY